MVGRDPRAAVPCSAGAETQGSEHTCTHMHTRQLSVSLCLHWSRLPSLIQRKAWSGCPSALLRHTRGLPFGGGGLQQRAGESTQSPSPREYF